jgi:transposase
MGCEIAETKKTARKPWEIEDGLWARIGPLLAVVQRNYRHPGRRRLDSRKVLCGILLVLYTGIRWEFLPQELGFGSGMTCWRRLRYWNAAGVWQWLHGLLLAEFRSVDLLGFSRAAVG